MRRTCQLNNTSDLPSKAKKDIRITFYGTNRLSLIIDQCIFPTACKSNDFAIYVKGCNIFECWMFYLLL